MGRRLPYRQELVNLLVKINTKLNPVLVEVNDLGNKITNDTGIEYIEPDVTQHDELNSSSQPNGMVLDVLIFAKIRAELLYLIDSLTKIKTRTTNILDI